MSLLKAKPRGLQQVKKVSKRKNQGAITRRENKSGCAQLNDVHDCMSLREEAGSHRQEVMVPDPFDYTSWSLAIVIVIITMMMVMIIPSSGCYEECITVPGT